MEKGYQFNEIDLQTIFKSVWGYAAPPFLYGLQNKAEKALFGKDNQNGDYSFHQASERREYSILGPKFYAYNANGNEVFMPIWLIDNGGTRYLLANTVMSMSNKKTIVETPMVNRSGSVKEQISIEDWEINVKGIIVSPDFDYPDQQVQTLKSLYDLNYALDIECVRTALAFEQKNTDKSGYSGKNEKVVLRSLTFPELKGVKNVQAFELNMVSDNPFELII